MTKKHNNKFITKLIIFILIIFTQKVIADFKQQCMLKIPDYKNNIIKNIDNEVIYIISDSIYGEYPKYINYNGNVNVVQKNQTLKADIIQLKQTQEINKNLKLELNAVGNVNYCNTQIYLTGSSAFYDLNNKKVKINNSKYVIIDNNSHGYADKIEIDGENNFSTMKNATFTTCLPENNIWSVFGSKLFIDHKEKLAKVYNARFNIGYIPIFYVPYIQLPFVNKNSYGFLSPTGKYSSNNGLEFFFPYQFKINKNYNVIITPHFISNRGFKINNELNYLVNSKVGTIAFDFLKYDHKSFKDNEYNKIFINNNRWLFYWKSLDNYLNNWNFDIDYTKVSDSQYFIDFNSPYGNEGDNYLKQKFTIGYNNSNWNIKTTHKQFQMLAYKQDSDIFKIEPQIDFNFYKNNLGILNFHTYAQVTRFINTNENNIYAIRLHIEPEINIPMSNELLKINNNFKLFATSYTQNIFNKNFNEKLKKNIFRFLPMFKCNVEINLKPNFVKKNNHFHITEPQIQYIYIPYKDQFNIKNFDSTLLLPNYNSLFSEKIYSGFDRIAPVNQIVFGIKHRLYDKNLNERFNFSIGQIYCLKQPNTEDLYFLINNKNKKYFLSLVNDAMWFVNKNFCINYNFKYDSNLNCITNGSAVAEYNLNFEQLFQLNYRFVNHRYIQYIGSNINTDNYYYSLPEYEEGISQIGTILNLPLNNFWNLVGSCFYNTKQWHLANQTFFLQYNTCCFAVNIGYERNITDFKKEKLNSKYYNKWLINIQFKGFNKNSNFDKIDILNKSAISYRTLF